MTRHGLTPYERWLMKVDKTETCWLWTAAKTADGYGVFGADSHKAGKAHRFSYEHHVGPVPDGLQLDHLCRVRHCVNPDHLEPVTQRENVRRGLIARGWKPKIRKAREAALRAARLSPAEVGRARAADAPPITDAQALEAARILAGGAS